VSSETVHRCASGNEFTATEVRSWVDGCIASAFEACHSVGIPEREAEKIIRASLDEVTPNE
jgi:hypothetical protein